MLIVLTQQTKDSSGAIDYTSVSKSDKYQFFAVNKAKMHHCNKIIFIKKFLTWIAYSEAFVAGRVIEGPVQVDFVTGAGDTQWTGIVATEGD